MQIIKSAKTRTLAENRQLTETVAEIISKVRENGDQAVLDYNTRFDHNDRAQFRLSPEEIETAYQQVSAEELFQLQQAAEHIRSFAQAQKDSLHPLEGFSPYPGVSLGHRVLPVSSCCCYVPGGGYPLYSTALMLVIPAKVAGVKQVVACTPAKKGTHSVDAKTVVAMDIAGADEIYAVGGAHAVAAFSYGTAQIPAVDLIVGPGNQYVTEAKRQCYGQVGIDFVAGPSEVLVLTDGSADPELTAADLLAQSEHDLLAKGILITTDLSLAKAAIAAVEQQLEQLATAGIARRSWEDYGEVLLADSMAEAIALTNQYAPEHLEVIVQQEQEIVEQLYNYGSLFIGQTTAEVFGDYISGTNHTLPTLKAARYTGGVWAGTFLKVCTHQRLNLQAMHALSGITSALARGEGLIAHARAAEIRHEKL